ncbi:Uncharacterized protein DBV15_00608 [Temnothorax longispinosus]|uniref:Uncharacterized protein n=1 Tax=Temnothorax longispinosus TaxID=300112 RepID=A0A4S2KXQ2_9HYME|nr:Uncharacterized protein DBV15_00608 [Temnothorax longispinosus]
MGATVLPERRDKGEKYRAPRRRAPARTYVRRPPPTSGRRGCNSRISATHNLRNRREAGGRGRVGRHPPFFSSSDTSGHTGTYPSLHPRLLSTTGTSKPSHGVVAANLVCELQNPPPPTRAYK